MRHTQYYNYCLEEMKRQGIVFSRKKLNGLLLDGNLDSELTVKLKNEFVEKENSFRNFVNGMSKILDIVPGSKLDELVETASSQIIPRLYDVFGCYVKIQEVKILRHLHLLGEDAKKREGAFIWHSDQHPDELVNIMIYLDDVTEEGCGPFQYVSDENGNPIYPRTPNQFLDENKVNNLGMRRSVLGKSGYYFVFDNNFIHRASPTTGQKRDAIIFQVRPTSKNNTKFLDWNYMNMKFDHQMANWSNYE